MMTNNTQLITQDVETSASVDQIWDLYLQLQNAMIGSMNNIGANIIADLENRCNVLESSENVELRSLCALFKNEILPSCRLELCICVD